MADIQLTKEQQEAISRKGKVIVSASAGSGKTFVMIRRLIDAILNGLGMQEFLAVTFTTKATESMVDKLRAALIQAINCSQSEAEKAVLKQKLAELPLADISTIHAFCSRLIKRYFYEIEVGDDFSVASKEDAEGKRIYDEAMTDLLESAYESPDENFSLLLKVFRSRDGVKGVRDAISEVYDKMRSDCSYRERLQEGGYYTEKSFQEACNTLLFSWKDEVAEYRAALNELSGRMFQAPPDCFEVYDAIDKALLLVEEETDIFALAQAVLPNKPTKSSKRKGISEEQKAFRDEINGLKDEVFKFIEKKVLNLGLLDYETELARYLESGKIVRALYSYVEKFDDIYSARKQKRLKLDYNDLEHYALRLLEKPQVLSAVREKYKMIFVDEYQDVNPTQERIISAIGGEEIFLVGDKKQAIYSFRGGKARYFTQKEGEYGEGNLLLSANFRSGKKILDFVNEVFVPVMTKERADIDYAAAPMRGGERYGDRAGVVKIHVCQKEKEEKEELSDIYRIEEHGDAWKNNRSAVGDKVLSLIRACVSAPAADEMSRTEEYFTWFDVDEGREKRVSYGDIAILVRSINTDSVKKMISYLVENGVPVTSLSEINVCDYPEVQMLVGILQTLDNPESDVPLCTALLSPVGGLQENDLAKIRIFGNRMGEEGRLPFRRLAEAYSAQAEDSTAEKLRVFYNRIALLKKKTYLYTAAEVLGELLSAYGIEVQLLSKPNGKNRMARVNRFLSECGADNVHDFLKRLKAIGYRVFYTENNGENSVKVLTIHKSKGLEYPVVILPLDKPFHTERGDLLFDDDLGFVAKYYDFENMKKQKTVLFRGVERRLKRAQVSDELNVLYVALTRAKYALHLVLSKEPERTFSYSNFSDFISPELAEKYRGEIPSLQTPRRLRDILPLVGCYEELAALSAVYEKPYAYPVGKNLAVKSSASSLMRAMQEEEYYPTRHPFSEGNEGKTSNRIGTAYHAFLEHADFSKTKGEYERLASVLEKEDYALLDREKCERILALPLLKSLNGDTLYKERKFIVNFPANAYDAEEESSDPVLYQGAIDLLAIGKGGVTLVDYKYSVKTKEEILRHYLPQIRLYRDAVAKLMRISPESIRAVILNIYREEEIFVNL